MLTKIEAINIKVGNILSYNNKLHLVTKTVHVKPGKRCTYIQVESRNIINKLKGSLRFRSSEVVQKATIEQKSYRFLYAECDRLILIDQQDHTQIEVSRKLFGFQIKLLDAVMEVLIGFYGGEPVMAKLPKKITALVESCESVVKGQTLASFNKPAIIKGDIRVLVPPFIQKGDKIVINSEDLKYLGKQK